jgi:hypothetical protein
MNYSNIKVMMLDQYIFRRPYDIFQVSEREFEDNDYIFKEIMKGIRVFLYLFFFVMILGCTVASKMSLLLITSGISQVRNNFTYFLLCNI